MLSLLSFSSRAPTLAATLCSKSLAVSSGPYYHCYHVADLSPFRPRWGKLKEVFGKVSSRRRLLTLAVETSCDDTSVAIVEKHKVPSSSSVAPTATIHFLENITADTRQYHGIHPVVALQSHQENLARLVDKALGYLPVISDSDGRIRNRHEKGHVENLVARPGDAAGALRRLPDIISVTRGPGMRANLSVGLDTCKGLSVAWKIPLIGVHHMQAHLLTPRLVFALDTQEIKGQDKVKDGGATMIATTPSQSPLSPSGLRPDFPFLSILVSGGHSMLVNSTSVSSHELLASTADIAIGEALDKSARLILPQSLLKTAKDTMYGKLLEKFAFPNGPRDYADYRPPTNRSEEQVKRESPWGWSITTPFANTRQLQFSFSCVPSTVTRLFSKWEQMGHLISDDERIALGREAMRTCFEHLASRIVIALETLRNKSLYTAEETKTLVVSGGVAANQFLLAVLRSFLDVRGFEHIEITAPPPFLCTDNAAMIAWAGIEMFEAGWRSELSCRALRRWSLDPRSDDGGVLGANGWRRMGTQYNPVIRDKTVKEEF